MLLVGILLYFSSFPAQVFAGLILDAELRFTYEDNVVGLLSDQQKGTVGGGGGTTGGMAMKAAGMGGVMGGGNNRYTGSGSGSSQSPGDFSAALSAEAGGYRDVGSDASLFVKGFASQTAYDTYTDLNSTIGGVSAGISASVSDSVSTRLAVLGKIKRFGDSQRNSNAYGGNLSVKEKLTPLFWLREFGEYEKNNADNSAFSYTGTTIGMGAGYALTKKTLFSVGYSYLVQKYDEPAGADLTTNSVFLNVEQDVSKHWALSGEYNRQLSKENISGSSTTNDIFSVAVRYSY
jgi:hypothetical protein